MLKSLVALGAAAASVIGFVAWLSLSQPARPTPEPQVVSATTPGVEAPDTAPRSAVPCVVPIAWRVADIDTRFGLSEAEARAAVTRAAEAWEQASGRSLFVHDPVHGFPIRFVYDERQAGAIERQRLERSIAAVEDRLAGERGELMARVGAFEDARATYEERRSDYDRRSAAHADSVRGWNSRGGAPDSVVPGLVAAERALDREKAELNTLGRELEVTRRVLQHDTDILNRRLAEHRSGTEALGQAVAPDRIESGLYRELVQREGGRAVVVQRAIDVFRFESPEDLWLVIAHELGHALGIGHAEEAGAVMSQEQNRTARPATRVQPSDVTLLKQRCPR